jgi:two-component system sensor histidine kinase KdpD
VRLDIAPETPLVEVDAAQIERALANLLENALRYSPPGSQVLLRAEPGGTELRIHVMDRGSGLPEEQREALFQPFRRGTAGHGSGLGLAIARGFAEANAGRLWAQDDPGGGHLVLSLPLAERRVVVPA